MPLQALSCTPLPPPPLPDPLPDCEFPDETPQPAIESASRKVKRNAAGLEEFVSKRKIPPNHSRRKMASSNKASGHLSYEFGTCPDDHCTMPARRYRVRQTGICRRCSEG